MATSSESANRRAVVDVALLRLGPAERVGRAESVAVYEMARHRRRLPLRSAGSADPVAGVECFDDDAAVLFACCVGWHAHVSHPTAHRSDLCRAGQDSLGCVRGGAE